MTHPANGLDDIVHQRVRLGVLAIAQEARRVEFGFLRSTLELTAGNLSQHLAVLEKAGFLRETLLLDAVVFPNSGTTKPAHAWRYARLRTAAALPR